MINSVNDTMQSLEVDDAVKMGFMIFDDGGTPSDRP
jgi:hypothetical protein